MTVPQQWATDIRGKRVTSGGYGQSRDNAVRIIRLHGERLSELGTAGVFTVHVQEGRIVKIGAYIFVLPTVRFRWDFGQ